MKKSRINSLALGLGLLATGFSAQAQTLGDALKAIQYEQYDKAKTILNKLNTPEAAYFLGDVYYKQGSIDSARIAFTKASSSPYGKIGTALLAGADGNGAVAKVELDKIIPQAGSDYQLAVELGKAFLLIPGTADQKAKSAIQVLTKASTMKTKNEQVYLALGDAHLSIVNGGEAAKNYQLAETTNPVSAEPYAYLAKLYLQARNASVSLRNVTEGLAKDPNYGPLYREQAETYRSANKFADAVTSYEKYLSLTDRSINSRIRYIQFLYLADNYDKANKELTDLKSKVKDFTKFPYLYRLDAIADYEIGIKSKDKQKLADGLTQINQLFQQKSVKPLPIDYAYLGKLQAANGNDSLAIQTFEKAISQDSSHSQDLYDALAKAYLNKKNYKAVSSLYDKMISHGDSSLSNYTYAGIYSYFSQASADHPDTSVLHRADKYLAKVNKKDSTYIPAYVYRAYLNGLMDKNVVSGAAQPYYQKIIDLSTSNPKFQQQIATDPKYKKYLITSYEYMLYYDFQKDKKPAAREIASKLKALDPGNEKAEALLKQK